jgi:hypothetical protein
MIGPAFREKSDCTRERPDVRTGRTSLVGCFSAILTPQRIVIRAANRAGFRADGNGTIYKRSTIAFFSEC